MTKVEPPSESPQRRQTRVLHVSDLHFGLSFIPEKWAEIRQIAEQLSPNLVVVSGDVVETPWRWRLRTAKLQMTALRNALRETTGNGNLELLTVPGNHDTRIQGVFPVAWLAWVMLFALAVLGSVCYLAGVRSIRWGWPPASWPSENAASGAMWVAIGALALFVVALVLRLCVTRDLTGALGAELVADRPKVFDELALGIAPFDSSTPSLSWARGRVSRKDMVACKRAIDSARSNPAQANVVWLAVVHHHPLPLPYDDEFERMMVMDNAGSFLSEIARRGVRLVLHGHKHHQHFARVMIDPLTDRRVEVAVLSAGTATRGRTSLVNRHGFNFLTIDADRGIRIRMFEAEGDGTFNETRDFDMVPADEHARWLFEQEKTQCPLSARVMTCVADVNIYGDAHFIREFRGVRTSLAQVGRIGSPLRAHSDSGFVEAYRAVSLSSHGPGVSLSTTRMALNEMQTVLQFKSSGLLKGHDPIDFLIEFQNNNAFALDRWQFSQMYAGRDDFSEDVRFLTPADVALEELVLFVRFDPRIRLPRRIDLRCSPRSVEEWRPIPHDRIGRIERQGVLEVHLAHPRPDWTYQLVWDLDEEADGPDEVAAGRALRLRRELAAKVGKPPSQELLDMLEASKDELLDHLSSTPGSPLQAALLAYDGAARELRSLASTYQENDPRRSAHYKFGLGIAGRSFKAADTITFIRPHNDTRTQWTGYVLGNGVAPESPADIPEECIVAFALAPPEAPDWPYAVLQFSSDEAGHPLSGLIVTSDNVLEVVAQGLSHTLTDYLESTIDSEHPAAGPSSPLWSST